MARLSLSELQALAVSLGFVDPALAAAVAMAESSGQTDAVGDVSIGRSLGLWQIYIPSHPEADPARLFDPVYNGQIAYQISRGGADWRPWSTYNNGAYQKFLTPQTPPEVVTPPAPASRTTPTAIVLAAALGMAVAAGYAAIRRREVLSWF
jgi:MYXO-CTERM domain-containing protein